MTRRAKNSTATGGGGGTTTPRNSIGSRTDFTSAATAGGGSSSSNNPNHVTSQPASHAIENNREHIQFLQRSLDRNDLEIASINELNTSLRTLRNLIMEHCGEMTLIQLGDGTLRVLTIPNPSTPSTTSSTVTDHATTTNNSLTTTSTTTTTTTTERIVKFVKNNSSVQRKNNNNIDSFDSSTKDPENDMETDLTTTDFAVDGMITETHNNNNNNSTGHFFYETYDGFQNEYQESLCIDFCLRMKLRRRLLSRLIRRLLRVATAMDGRNDTIQPPAVPKYLSTEFRLHVDEVHVNEFMEQYQRQEVCIQRMTQRNEAYEEQELYSISALQNNATVSSSKTIADPKIETVEQDNDTTSPKKTDVTGTEENNNVSDLEVVKSSNEDVMDESDSLLSPGPVASDGTVENTATTSTGKLVGNVIDEAESLLVEAVVSSTEVKTEQNDEGNTLELVQSKKVATNESGTDEENFIIKVKSDSGTSDDIDEEKKLDTEMEIDNEKFSFKPLDREAIVEYYKNRQQILLDDDYEVLKDYKDVYEKLIEPVTGTVLTYSVLAQQQKIHGIGDSGRMTGEQSKVSIPPVGESTLTNEQEVEWKRYKDLLAQKIPIQPTYEELGYQYNVFNKEKRIGDILAKEKEEKERLEYLQKQQEQNDERKSKESGSSDEDDMEDDDDSDNDHHVKNTERIQQNDEVSSSATETDDDDVDKDEESVSSDVEKDDKMDVDPDEKETENKDIAVVANKTMKAFGGKELLQHIDEKRGDEQANEDDHLIGNDHDVKEVEHSVDDKEQNILEKAETSLQNTCEDKTNVIGNKDNLQDDSVVSESLGESVCTQDICVTAEPTEKSIVPSDLDRSKTPAESNEAQHDNVDVDKKESVETNVEIKIIDDKLEDKTLGENNVEEESLLTDSENNKQESLLTGTDTEKLESEVKEVDEGNADSENIILGDEKADSKAIDTVEVKADSKATDEHEEHQASVLEVEISDTKVEHAIKNEENDKKDEMTSLEASGKDEIVIENKDAEERDNIDENDVALGMVKPNEADPVLENADIEMEFQESEQAESQKDSPLVSKEDKETKEEKASDCSHPEKIDHNNHTPKLEEPEPDADKLKSTDIEMESQESEQAESQEDSSLNNLFSNEDEDIKEEKGNDCSHLEKMNRNDLTPKLEDPEPDVDKLKNLSKSMEAKDAGGNKSPATESSTRENELRKGHGMASPDSKVVIPIKTRQTGQGDEKCVVQERKRARPISLVPIPSFYEQDLKRIRLVHADLVSASMYNHGRSMLNDCTMSYNSAFQNSNELYDRRQHVQNKLNSLLIEIRNLQSQRKDYAVHLAVEKNRWHNKRIQYEQSVLNNILPSRNGKYRTGTSYIQRYMTRPDLTGLSQQVGDCLADVVDVVDSVAKGMIRLSRYPEQFIPPPNSFGGIDPVTGESLSQRHQRLEKELRQEMDNVSEQLNVSEETRSSQWNKMLKIKSEYGIPDDIVSNTGSHRSIKLDVNNMMSIVVPPLRKSSAQNVFHSSHPGIVNPNIGSYKPAARRSVSAPRRPVPRPVHHDDFAKASYPMSLDHPTAMGYPGTPSTDPDSAAALAAAESKYSAARVKERIGADGTVAPVSEPKKSKDGLYQRPAGRTRKGMDWDAIRGIWIPLRETYE